MHKEQFSPKTLRRLWEERDSDGFAS